MKKKFYITILTIIAVVALSFSYTFAANDIPVVDGIRNAVGGAENVVENAGKGVVDGVRNITNAGENTMENVAGNIGNGAKNAGNKMAGALTTDNNYNATRTATNATGGTFLGMNSTVFTWLIMAAVGVAIVALIWMYAKQNNTSYND